MRLLLRVVMMLSTIPFYLGLVLVKGQIFDTYEGDLADDKVVVRVPTELSETIRHNISSFIKEASRCYNVPGVSLAVVTAADTWTTGFGQADVENKVPSSEDTVYCVGSITKSFATTLITILLQNNTKYNWDSPVSAMLPQMKWRDAHLQKDVTLRDLASHRTGIGGNFALLLSSAWNVTEIARIFPYLPRDAALRTRWMYNNLAYVILGQVAEQLGNDSWPNLIRHYIASDALFIEDIPQKIAKGYVQRNQTVVEDQEINDIFTNTLVGAAGDICLSAKGMVPYIKSHLAMLNCEKCKLKDLYRPHMFLHNTGDLRKPVYPVTFSNDAYGLGFFLSNYRGYDIVRHGGHITSYISQLNLIPSRELGVFISTNGPQVKQMQFTELVTMYIQDLLLGLGPWLDTESVCQFPRPWKGHSETFAPMVFTRGEKLGRNPTDYIGSYGNYGFGKMQVSYNKSTGSLFMVYGNARASLWPVDENKDVFQVEFTDYLSGYTLNDVDEKARKQLPVLEFKFDTVSSIHAHFVHPKSAVFEKGLDPQQPPVYPLPCTPGISTPPVTSESPAPAVTSQTPTTAVTSSLPATPVTSSPETSSLPTTLVTSSLTLAPETSAATTETVTSSSLTTSEAGTRLTNVINRSARIPGTVFGVVLLLVFFAFH